MIPGRAAKRRRKGSAVPEVLNSLNLEQGEADLDQQFCHDIPYCTNLHGGACRCKKDSPHCLAGLLPSPDGHRRSGLWSRDPAQNVSLLLGEKHQDPQIQDPAVYERKDMSAPVGLRNQGSTCYLNGAFQCLFMISRLRQLVYNVETNDQVIKLLRNTFAQMQASCCRVVELTEFISLLGLDAQIQQDPQEFFGLLVSLISKKLADHVSEEVSAQLKYLLQGSHSYYTFCKGCEQFSESSSEETDFASLMVPIQGFKCLEESLDTMQKPEQMTGDNQYKCSRCNNLCDASRQFRIRRLPPYLCLSLLRMVYDVKHGDRKKTMEALSFPERLDMRSLVSMEGEEASWESADMIYELYGILFHKGPSPHSGHYVAHIKDQQGRWWRCDDIDIEQLKDGPSQCPQDLGTSTKRAEKRARDKDDSGSTAETAGGICSTNAYMLFYRVCKAGQDSGDNEWHVELPEGLEQSVRAANALFLNEMQSWKVRMGKGLSLLNARKMEVHQRISEAVVLDPSTEYRWVSLKWLKAWVDSIVSFSPDNKDIACPHGKLDPNKIAEARKVSKVCWEAMHGEYMAEVDDIKEICKKCCTMLQISMRVEQSYQASRDELITRVLEADADGEQPPSGYFISRAWLMNYKKGKSSIPTASPTAAITCPHGDLLPDSQKSRRVAVSSSDWEFLQTDWTEKQLAALKEQIREEQRSAREATPLIDLTDPRLATSEQQDLEAAIALSIEEAKASEGIAVEGQTVQQDKPSGPFNPSMTLGEALIAAAKQASRGLAHQVYPPSLPPNPETLPQPSSNEARDSPGLPDSEDDMERAIRLSLQSAQRDKVTVHHDEDLSDVQQQQPGHGSPATHVAPSSPAVAESSKRSSSPEQLPSPPPLKLPEFREFPIQSSTVCGVCQAVLQVGLLGQRVSQLNTFRLPEEVKAKMDRLKLLCPKLAAGHTPILQLGEQYCLLPTGWVRAMKRYLFQPVTNKQIFETLPSLDSALDDLLCPCHRKEKPLLGTAVNPAIQSRGKWICEGFKQYVVVDFNEGLQLLRELCPSDDVSIPYATPTIHPRLISVWLLPNAEHAPLVCVPPAAAAPGSAQIAIVESDSDGMQDVPLAVRGLQGPKVNPLGCNVETCPNASADTIAVADIYDNADASVLLELVDKSGLNDIPGTRRGARRRNARMTMPITSTTLLSDAKMVFAETHVLLQQNLSAYSFRDHAWRLLESTDDDISLRELGIEPGAEIRFVEINGPSESLPPPPTTKSGPIEQGFAGTLLHDT